MSDFKEGERERTRDVNGKIYVTDNKYRLPACVDMRASVYEKKGVHTIYHIALENDDYYMNYGVYANGLLVETCSKRYLKELSNMELFWKKARKKHLRIFKSASKNIWGLKVRPSDRLRIVYIIYLNK